MLVRVKICCISSSRELQIAAKAGAAAVGFVSAMPSGPGVISERRIARLAALAPGGLDTFLLTSQQNPGAILAQQRFCKVSTLQICDALPISAYLVLRRSLPEVTLVQVIHVRGEESINEAEQISPYVDRLLLDSGNPGLLVKELGGTGRYHDWQLSRRICETVETPVYLAGGLRPDNVAEAIDTVRPYGVDVCSGVRTAGKLDPARLTAFMQAVAASAS